MPWYDSVTGELVRSPSDDQKSRDELIYKPSIFAKEELPTWSEVYEEFYTHKVYEYNPEVINHQVNDLYWNFSHTKFLIATATNQFNKMLFEDGMRIGINNLLSQRLPFKVDGLQFLCGDGSCAVEWIRSNPSSSKEIFKSIPEVYTFPMPNLKVNPFIINAYKRIDVTKLNGRMFIQPIIQIKNPSSHVYTLFMPVPGISEFNIVIDVMMIEFKEYFNGDIGWKDENGNVIEGDPGTRDCTGAGYIPR